MKVSRQLQSFVTETIVEILQAVFMAQHQAKGFNAKVGMQVRNILTPPKNGQPASARQEVEGVASTVEFDLAVTSSTESATGGEGGIKVFVLNAGGSKSSETSHSEVSRIKFTVPITFGVRGD